MAGWREALGRTRRTLGALFQRILSRPGSAAADLWDQLEADLLAADVPVRLVQTILDDMREARGSAETARARVRQRLLDACGEVAPFEWRREASPLALLLIGVNGSGKTTTAARLARLVQKQGLTPLLGAADTYRAAGSDQLKLWAERLGCAVVGGRMGGDAAAVAHDAFSAARAQGADVLLLDTAGRMHTRQPLLDELRKIHKVLGRLRPGAPEETWLVLDATLGQNALSQAKVFHAAVPLTGLVLTKLDGSSRGGVVLSIAQELKLPVRYVGIGEGPDDLAPFDPHAFVDALLNGDSPSFEKGVT